jgi:hypothetical protein
LLLTSTYATEIGPLLAGAGRCAVGAAPGAAFATPAMPAKDSVSTLVVSRTFHLDLDPRIIDQAPLLGEGDRRAGLGPALVNRFSELNMLLR